MVSINKIVLALLIVGVISSNSNIVINMSDSSLERLGEMLIENYITNNLAPRETSGNSFLWKMIKFFICVTQLIGVTLSLIAANIFTPYFQSLYTNSDTIQSTAPIKSVISFISHSSSGKNTSFSPSTMCPHDFGCDRNLCWRTCHRGHKNEKLSWCYTSKPNSGKYTQYIEMQECSPCWECFGSCHHK